MTWTNTRAVVHVLNYDMNQHYWWFMFEIVTWTNIRVVVHVIIHDMNQLSIFGVFCNFQFGVTRWDSCYIWLTCQIVSVIARYRFRDDVMNVDCIHVCFKRMGMYREWTRTICALGYHIGCGLVSRSYRHFLTFSPSLSGSFCLSRYGYPVLRRLFLDVFVIAHVFLLCVWSGGCRVALRVSMHLRFRQYCQ